MRIQTTQWGTWPTFASWNWPGHEGKEIAVEEMKATFTLPYGEGTLRAEGIADGKVAETATLSTAGAPAALRITADRSNLTASTSDLCYITIEMVDKHGNVVPTADDAIEVTVSGPATLQALGNADIKDNDPYFDNKHKVWKGRAQAVLRPIGKPGTAAVKVTAGGIPAKTVKLKMTDMDK